MKIKDIMSKKPKALDTNLSVQEAAMQMTEKGTDFCTFPVTENNKLVGVMTIRDLVMNSIAKNKDMKMTKIKEIMTKKVISCHEDDSLETVAKIMKDHDINGLPVLNSMEQMIGFVTMDDFMHKSNNEQMWQDLALALNRIS